VIGLRVGLRAGISTGTAVGLGADQLGGGRTLIVLLGQSNAQDGGITTDLTTANTTFGTSYSNVSFISRQDGNTDPPVFSDNGPEILQATNWQSASNNKMGLQMSMMRDLDRARPSQFALVRFALGDTSSANWSPSSNYPASITGAGGPNLFNQAINYINAALGTLGCGSVGCIVWEQGGSDALSDPPASNYAAFLTSFLTAIRAHYPNVPFVFGQLNAQFNAGAFGATVVAQQQAFQGTMPKTTLIVEDSITIGSGEYDGVHYNANGMVDLGHLYAVGVGAQLGFNIPPLASFTDVPTGLSVAFTDTSQAFGGATITGWAWDFGDGNTSSSQSPTHVYAGAGTYNVKLTATDSSGSKNTSAVVSITVSASIPGVTRDATSGIYTPANATEWTTFMTAVGLSALGNPNSLYNCQEASGNLADSIGALALTAAGTPAQGYQQAVTGWSRKGVTIGAGGTARFAAASGTGPNMSTTSALWVFFMAVTTVPPNNRTWGAASANGAVICTGLVNATPVPNININSVDTVGSISPVGSTIGPWSIQLDRGNSRAEVTTPKERVQGTFSAAVTDGLKGFGACGGTSLDQTVVYAFMYSGTNGQMSAANLKALLTAMGFSIPWS